MSKTPIPFEKYLNMSMVKNTPEEMKLSEDKEAELVKNNPNVEDYQAARKEALENVFDAQNHLVIIASQLTRGNTYDETNYFAKKMRKELAAWMYNYHIYGGAIGEKCLVTKVVDDDMYNTAKYKWNLSNFIDSLEINGLMKLEKKNQIPKDAPKYINWKRLTIDAVILALIITLIALAPEGSAAYILVGIIGMAYNGTHTSSHSKHTLIPKVYYAPQQWDSSWNDDKITEDGPYSLKAFRARKAERKAGVHFSGNIDGLSFGRHSHNDWDDYDLQNQLFMQQMQDEQNQLFMQETQQFMDQQFMDQQFRDQQQSWLDQQSWQNEQFMDQQMDFSSNSFDPFM